MTCRDTLEIGLRTITVNDGAVACSIAVMAMKAFPEISTILGLKIFKQNNITCNIKNTYM